MCFRFNRVLERLRNHTCTGTGTCSEVLNPVSVILKINRSLNHKLVYPYFGNY